MKLAKSLIFRPNIRPCDRRNYFSMYPWFLAFLEELAETVGPDTSLYLNDGTLINTTGGLRTLTGNGELLLFNMDNLAGLTTFRDEWLDDEKVTTITTTATGVETLFRQREFNIYMAHNTPSGLNNSIFITGTGVLQTVSDQDGSGDIAIRNLFTNTIQDRVTVGGVRGETTLTHEVFTIDAAIRKSAWSVSNVPGATENDYAPNDLTTSYVILLEPTGNSILTGFDATGAVQGSEYILINNSAFTITLKEQDGGSIVGNQFKNSGAADIVIPAGGQATILHGETTVVGTDFWFVTL